MLNARNTHYLKLEHEFIEDVLYERKRFEIRKNDRDFKIGDLVKFIPLNIVFEPDISELNSAVLADQSFEITYIISDYGLKPGYVVFGITKNAPIK